MGLRARHGHWHYRFEIAGHEWSGDTGLVDSERNRKAAERVELEARQAIEQGKSHLLRIQPIPFSDAADKFLRWCEGHHRKKPNTTRRIRTSFASIEVHFGRTPVSAITSGDVATIPPGARMSTRSKTSQSGMTCTLSANSSGMQ